ncbi:MAG: hypothetical protein ACPGWR_15585 [Ardenticatenaceae bacterium]
MLQRNDQDWVEELRGERGGRLQKQAHQELAAYLYRIVYHYLVGRQSQHHPYMLISFTPLQLAALAQKFVQQTLEKVACNDFALLDQFEGEGSFTSWAAAIAARDVALVFCISKHSPPIQGATAGSIWRVEVTTYNNEL